MIDLHNTSSLEELAKTQRIDPQQLRILRRLMLRRFQSWSTALNSTNERFRGVVRTSIAPHSLVLDQRFDSAQDGASRLVFRTAAGHRLESVLLRIASGRTSVCISTQVGCAARCAFCATGQMGLVENLTSSEILDQVVQAGQIAAAEQRSLRNIVFMGMGEPLHNEAHFHEALEQLIDPRCFAFAPQRIAVSTVGVPQGMIRLAQRFPGVRLALSLHSARQQVREQIIPVARRHELGELRATLEEIATFRKSRVMIAYLMFAGLTDTDEDVIALSEFLTGLDVHINLIPFNPIGLPRSGAPVERSAIALKSSTPQRTKGFAGELRQRGFPVTVRRSLGSDVAAACGQLVQRTADSGPRHTSSLAHASADSPVASLPTI